jgi:hypothetical protein
MVAKTSVMGIRASKPANSVPPDGVNKREIVMVAMGKGGRSATKKS